MKVGGFSSVALVVALAAVLVAVQFTGLGVTTLGNWPVTVNVQVQGPGGGPVSGAVVEFDSPDFWGGYDGKPDYSAATDAAGRCSLFVPQLVYSVRTEASGYEADERTFDARGATGEPRSLVVTLESGGPGGGFTVKVYAVGPTGSRVSRCSMDLGAVSHVTASDGGATFLNVAAGTHLLHVYGEYRTGPLTWAPFDYSTIISVTGSGVWTAHVASGSVTPGSPPPEPFDPAKWAAENWILLVCVAVGLYVVGVFFPGAGTVLIKQRRL